MKNGHALKGHKRILVSVNPSPIPNRLSVGGWDVSCLCGWFGGNSKDYNSAKKVYKDHLDFQINQVPIRCKCCGIEKPRSQMKKSYRYMCIDCDEKRAHAWQSAHPDQTARSKKNHDLKKKWGISILEAEAMLENQGGICKICGKKLELIISGKDLHIDHDHSTGKIRGILCFRCNMILGQTNDDIELLERMVSYLKDSKIESIKYSSAI